MPHESSDATTTDPDPTSGSAISDFLDDAGGSDGATTTDPDPTDPAQDPTGGSGGGSGGPPEDDNDADNRVTTPDPDPTQPSGGGGGGGGGSGGATTTDPDPTDPAQDPRTVTDTVPMPDIGPAATTPDPDPTDPAQDRSVGGPDIRVDADPSRIDTDAVEREIADQRTSVGAGDVDVSAGGEGLYVDLDREGPANQPARFAEPTINQPSTVDPETVEEQLEEREASIERLSRTLEDVQAERDRETRTIADVEQERQERLSPDELNPRERTDIQQIQARTLEFGGRVGDRIGSGAAAVGDRLEPVGEAAAGAEDRLDTLLPGETPVREAALDAGDALGTDVSDDRLNQAEDIAEDIEGVGERISGATAEPLADELRDMPGLALGPAGGTAPIGDTPAPGVVEGVGSGIEQAFGTPSDAVNAVRAGQAAEDQLAETVEEEGVVETAGIAGATAATIGGAAAAGAARQAVENPARTTGELGLGLVGGTAAVRATEVGTAAARVRIEGRRGPDIDATETTRQTELIESGEQPRFETDGGASGRVAADEFRTRAAENPEDLQDAVDAEQVTLRSETARLPGDLEAQEGNFELPGLFASGDFAPLRFGENSGGLFSEPSLRAPRLFAEPERASAFETPDVEAMPPSAAESGFALRRTDSGEIVETDVPQVEAATRAADNPDIERVPDPTTRGFEFLTERADRGTAFVRPRGDRTPEFEAIFPPETRFERVTTGTIEARGERGTLDVFELADEQPGAEAAEDVADAADDVQDTFTAEEISRRMSSEGGVPESTPVTPAPTVGATPGVSSGVSATQTPTVGAEIPGSSGLSGGQFGQRPRSGGERPQREPPSRGTTSRDSSSGTSSGRGGASGTATGGSGGTSGSAASSASGSATTPFGSSSLFGSSAAFGDVGATAGTDASASRSGATSSPFGTPTGGSPTASPGGSGGSTGSPGAPTTPGSPTGTPTPTGSTGQTPSRGQGSSTGSGSGASGGSGGGGGGSGGGGSGGGGGGEGGSGRVPRRRRDRDRDRDDELVFGEPLPETPLFSNPIATGADQVFGAPPEFDGLF